MEIDYKKQFKDICKNIILNIENILKIKLHYVAKIQIDIGKIGLN